MTAIKFQSLENCSLHHLAETFNLAFAKYMIPVQLSAAQLRQKIYLDRIDLRCSAGAFAEGRCVGFIFTGCGNWQGTPTAYNAGTGVIPAFRGQRLTQQMYDFLLPIFRKENIQQALLEVIDSNEVAIHNYKALGFRQTRVFDCFIHKGGEPPKHELSDEYQEHEVFDLHQLKGVEDFWNSRPSWQNELDGIKSAQGIFATYCISRKGEIVAYGIKDPAKGRIAQFGVHLDYRRQQLGSAIFSGLYQLGNPKQSIINIDQEDVATTTFLRKQGFEYYIGQYEMCWEIG